MAVRVGEGGPATFADLEQWLADTDPLPSDTARDYLGDVLYEVKRLTADRDALKERVRELEAALEAEASVSKKRFDAWFAADCKVGTAKEFLEGLEKSFRWMADRQEMEESAAAKLSATADQIAALTKALSTPASEGEQG